jgi:hypothetical protein
MLPKFLLADNSQNDPDKIYVVHTQKPRCIFETYIDSDFIEEHIVHWIDPAPASAGHTQELINLAAAFMEDELQAQEDLFDEEFE